MIKIGTMVHYVCVDGTERPAIVIKQVKTDDEGRPLVDVVALQVFDLMAPYPVPVCFHSQEEKKPRTWHYAEDGEEV